jgi:hypothetical protein
VVVAPPIVGIVVTGAAAWAEIAEAAAAAEAKAVGSVDIDVASVAATALSADALASRSMLGPGAPASAVVLPPASGIPGDCAVAANAGGAPLGAELTAPG